MTDTRLNSHLRGFLTKPQGKVPQEANEKFQRLSIGLDQPKESSQTMENRSGNFGEKIFEELAGLLGVTFETLESSIGSNWNSTPATPNMIIRGDDMGVVFFEDDSEDDDQEIETSYPDIGILIEYPDLIHVGTLRLIYNPAPSGYDLKTLITLSSDNNLDLEKLEKAIEHAAKAFALELKTCRYCKENLPSYYMDKGRYCYSCGSKELGIVY